MCVSLKQSKGFLGHQTNKKVVVKKKRNIKDDYFYGIGVLIADELGISVGYVRDILNGKFPNRKSKSTRKVKVLAKEMMKRRNG